MDTGFVQFKFKVFLKLDKSDMLKIYCNLEEK